jgi:hypothetical protein
MYSQNLQLRKRKRVWNFDKACPSGIRLVGKCENGHTWIQDTTCKREDCFVCGVEGSIAHYRRYVRGVPYIFEIYEDEGVLGYLVITFDKNELDCKKITKKDFTKIRRYVIRMLKRELGSVRGIARWHWAGEKSRDFYPHLNVLFGNGYIERKKLDRIKMLIYEKLGVKVVHYSYTRNIIKMLHWLRYVVRPTFLLQNQVSYSFIKGFRNNVVFGKFKRKYEKVEIKEWINQIEKLFKQGYLDLNIDEDFVYIYHLVKNRCPYCFTKIKWQVADEEEIFFVKKRKIRGGFYEVLG